jgi:hypothetical protein
VGHVETPGLVEAGTVEGATEAMGALTLYEVQELLEAAIVERTVADGAGEGGGRDG